MANPAEIRPEHLKLYRFVRAPNDYNRSQPALDVDYVNGLTTSLVNVVTQDDFGRITKREFFGSFDVATGVASDLIIQEDWIWTLDNVGQPARTEVSSSYIRENDTVHPTTGFRVTYYVNQGNTIPERREREALIEQTKAELMSLSDEFGQTPWQARSKLTDFCVTFREEIWLWEQIYSDELQLAIDADTTINWLNIEYPVGGGKTIRERLVKRFTPPPGTTGPPP